MHTDIIIITVSSCGNVALTVKVKIIGLLIKSVLFFFVSMRNKPRTTRHFIRFMLGVFTILNRKRYWNKLHGRKICLLASDTGENWQKSCFSPGNEGEKRPYELLMCIRAIRKDRINHAVSAADSRNPSSNLAQSTETCLIPSHE